MEVKAIVEHHEMKSMGGLVAAWELWEGALLPSLLSGAGTWLRIIDAAIKLCNSVQNFYCRLILNNPESCPRLSLMCDTFMIDCKYCVWKEKCLFLLRIKQLEDNALAKRIYKEADINNWPGLATEAQAICEQIEIKDITKQETPKEDYFANICISL